MADNNQDISSDFNPLINLTTIGTKLEDFEEIPSLNKKYTILKKSLNDYDEIMKSKLDNKTYIIKKVDKDDKQNNVKNQLRETIKLINLNHENIVNFYGYFEDKENISKFKQIRGLKNNEEEDIQIYCLVFEYFPNDTLQNFLNVFNLKNNFQPMEQNIIIKIFKQLLDALKYLHSKNIIHRDIRLDNILLDKNQNLKITNFLIFVFYRDKKRKSPQNKDSNLHSNSTRIGRRDFISPEILEGIEYDAKTDIYSLGLTMLCLMSKTFPIIMRKFRNTKKTYREINSNNIWDIYNKSLKKLVLKMINEDKLLRPSSEEAYKELLEIEKLIKIHNIKDLEAIGTKLIDFEEIPKDKNCKYSILKCNDRKYFEIMSSKKTKINYLIKKMNKNGKSFSMKDFKRETEIMKDLNHENIIKYYGFFEDKEEMKKYNEIHKDNKEKKNDIEIYCLVFEYDPSFIFLEDYYNKYKKNFSDEKDFKPLDENIILNFIKQLIEGLKYLQKKSIILRNIKLDSILLDENNKIKIFDFSLSALIPDDNPENKDKETFLFTKYEKAGRIDFIPKELRYGQIYDYRVDIFSLGLTILCLMTFEKPIKILRNNFSLTYRITDYNKMNKSYNERLRNLVINMINENKENRPNVSQVYDELLKIEKEINIENKKKVLCIL